MERERALLEAQREGLSETIDQVYRHFDSLQQSFPKDFQRSDNNAQIRALIEKIVEDTRNLLQIVVGVNARTQNLAASTEEISASTTMIMEIVEQVRQELANLEEQSKEAIVS